MKSFLPFYYRAWRPTVMGLVLAGIAYLLFFQRLGSLVPGYAPRELTAAQAASSWHVITTTPINLPYKLVVLAFHELGYHHLVLLRIVAASFGVGASLLFYSVARAWFSYRVAFLTTVLFTTSAGFLHVARLGSSMILQMSLLGLMALVIWLQRKPTSRIAFCTSVPLTAILLYIPGMIWFVLLMLVILRKDIAAAWGSRKPVLRIIAGLIIALLLTPLVIAIVGTPKLLLSVIGLPQTFVPLGQMAHNFQNAVLSIGAYSQGTPDLWLGHAPLLDIVELVLLALGIYSVARHFRAPHGRFIIVALIISIVLVGLAGPVTISSLLPLLYLLIGAGIGALLRQWFVVFPRNPLAKAAGIAAVCIMLGFSILYQTRAYFVAWPHANATRQHFAHREDR